jgi:hypothetical protein
MSNPHAIEIIKSDGTREHFDEQKLKRSLERSGATDEAVHDVLEGVSHELRDGVTTHDIYHRAYELLKKHEHRAASRYSLRRALLALGPTGYPFEDFIGEIYKTQGYDVTTRVVLPGKCVTHELDVIAKKDGVCIGAELKFHNDISVRTDVKVTLYVRARFDDLHARHLSDPSTTPQFDEVRLVTNTKFTSQAIEYASCAGLTLIGWNYPTEGNLQDIVEQARAHPITSLTSLSNAHKHRLLEQGVILCRSLPAHVDTLRSLGISEEMMQSTLDEANRLCAEKDTHTI